MTPPHELPRSQQTVDAGSLSAASSRLITLTDRKDFLRAARGPSVATPGFVLQMRKRRNDEAQGIRVGFTCSKKVGNAVARNAAKRRLREIARLVLPRHGRSGYDYVLIGRANTTATRPFSMLLNDLRQALSKTKGGAP